MKTETWKIEGTKTGHVRIEIGGKPASISAADAGRMAAMLLDCAKGEGSPDTTPTPGGAIDWIPVRPTTITLGSSPQPGHEALVFGFGPALLGVSLKRQGLKQLGEAMIALSAEGQAQ